MASLEPVSVSAALESLAFLANRTPDTSDAESADAFARLADYRDGAVFVGHWAGSSAWERHPVGDEIVMVLDGETRIVVLDGAAETSAEMGAGSMVVVPRNTWHRFDTPVAVKVLSVTPQPTEHSPTRPRSDQ